MNIFSFFKISFKFISFDVIKINLKFEKYIAEKYIRFYDFGNKIKYIFFTTRIIYSLKNGKINLISIIIPDIS